MSINFMYMTSILMTAVAFLSWSGQVEATGVTKIIQGAVKEVGVNAVDILDDVNGNRVQIRIDSNTVYDNIQELIDLREGDKVQVSYQTKYGRNIAIMITRMEIDGDDVV